MQQVSERFGTFVGFRSALDPCRQARLECRAYIIYIFTLHQVSRSHAVGFGALLEGGMDGRKDWKLLLLAGWALGEERSE